MKSGWSRIEYITILNKIFSQKTSQKIIPLIIDDMKDTELPYLLGDTQLTWFLKEESYKKFLEFLSINKINEVNNK